MGKKQPQFSGFPGDCSPEQLEVLAKFRKEVRDMGCTDPPYDDPYLLRFLRARKFDLNKTMIMWKNYIQWRKDNDVDNILNMKFPEIEEAKKFYPHGYFKTDKEGRPIYIERIGYLKFDQLVKIIPLDRLQLYFIQSYERLTNQILPACTRAKGQRVDQTCYIIDLKNAGAKMMSSKMWDIIKIASKIGQDYYPEILGQMFIINVPLFFYGIWNMIKHFLDEKTTKKIHLLGSKYHKELVEHISDDNLPDFLGGKVTAKDYGEPFLYEQGPWMNEIPLANELPKEELPILSNKNSLIVSQIVEKEQILVIENPPYDLEDAIKNRKNTDDFDWEMPPIAVEGYVRTDIREFAFNANNTYREIVIGTGR